MKTRIPTFTTLCVAAVLVALGGTAALAQVKKGKTRVLTTKQLMAGIVKPHCTSVKEGLDASPADDKAWDVLAMHSALLNEASYTLMDDGRCPDGIWADAASKALRQGSADLVKAAEAKDLAAAKTAFGAMTKACKACHDKHKEK
jgi:cytochrome c556